MIYLAMNKTKLGQVFGTVGIVTGLLYSMKTHKGFGQTLLFTSIFAVSGVLIGNTVTKFYE